MDKQEEKHLTKLKFYRAFFNTKPGKSVLMDLIKNHHVLGSTMVKGDPYETIFKEGERNVVLRILSILEVDPIQLQELIKKEEEMRDEY